MRQHQAWDNISQIEIRRLVQLYSAHLPQDLSPLDSKRYVTIPEAVASRSQACLEKKELVELISWKLKHGKWRPNLYKLAESNTDAAVHDTTKLAFEQYSKNQSVDEALATLTKLSGVGPASASLLLSVYDPQNVPFFSDELFRYVHVSFDAKGDPKGWDKIIKYNKSEFADLNSKVKQMRQRLQEEAKEEVPCLDLEKAAYVLGNPAFALVDAECPAGTKGLVKKVDKINGAEKMTEPSRKRKNDEAMAEAEPRTEHRRETRSSRRK